MAVPGFHSVARSCGVGAIVVFALSVAVSPLAAQEKKEETEAQKVVEEEITVTAMRRETPIDSIPVSIVALQGERLQQNEINTLEEASRFVPNFLVGDGALTTAVSIRGIGSQPDRSFEQSVGLFVDGVYMPRSRQYRSSFLDTDRVEILRGPQAVLFGLNATAGAVSVVTRRTRPGAAAFVDVTAGYEIEHGGPRVTAVAGGSVGEKLGLRIAVQFRDEGDYFVNEFDGGSENGRRDETLRLSAVWQPSTWAEVDFKYEHGSFDVDGDMGEQYGPPELNQLLLFGLPGADDGQLDWRRNMDRSFYPTVTEPFGGRDSPGISQSYDEFVLSANFDVGKHALKAVFGYSDLGWDSYADTDASPLAIFVSGINEKFEQTSLELVWTSPSGRAIDLLAGFYGHDNELSNDQPNLFDPTFTFAPGAFGFDQVYTNSSFTTASSLWSFFATATWNITPKVRLTGGARYADETKDYRRAAQCLPVRGGVIDFDPSEEDRQLFEENSSDFVCGTLDGFSDDRRSTALMPELAVEWDAGDGALWYAKYSSSRKSGGFAGALSVAADSIEYDDEQGSGLEVGRRSTFAGGRARFNAALFQTDFDDLQVNAFNPVTGSGYITNAASARSRGIELDGGWLASNTVRLNGAIAYLDAKYTSFPEAPCPISQVLAGVAPPCDATGKTLPRAPKFSASLSADLDQPLNSGLRIQAGLVAGYTGSYDVDPALEPALAQGAYPSIGARIGIAAADGRWSVALVGTNLTNEAVLNDALPFLSNIGYLQPPRMVWLRGSYRWGSAR